MCTVAYKRLLSLIFVLVVTVFGFTTSLKAQSNVEKVVITQIDADNFPQVSVDFRAIDDDNSVVTNLTNNAVNVYENGERIETFEVEEQERSPIYLVFVIDQGQYFYHQNLGESVIRQSISYFTSQGYFRDDYDTVAILTRIADGETGDRTDTLLGPTQSASQFLSAVNRLDFEDTNRTDGVTGVTDGLGELAQLAEAGTGSMAVIYIGSIIDDVNGQSSAERRAGSAAALAKEQNVRLYVFHTDPSGEFSGPLTAFTRGAGGQYIRLTRDSNALNLTTVYEDIVEQAQTYTLRYRSRSSESGTRSVVIVPNGVPFNAASDTAKTYTVSVTEPRVLLDIPAGTIERNPERNSDDDTWSYRVDTVTIEVTINWGENPPREIIEADLVVDGSTQLTVEPLIENNRFQLTWDITNIEQETRTVPVQVRVRDELGVEIESASNQVTVDATLPDVVVRETAVPLPTIAPTVDPCVVNPAGTDCITDRAVRFSPLATVVLAVVVIILAILLFANRGRVAQVANTAGEAVRKQVADVRKTLLGGGGRKGRKVIAKLRVEVARRDLIGKDIDIYTNTTTLGRNPKLCEVQLFDEDDVSTVSGLHCTIQYDPSRHTFFITDDNSANGTSVNDQVIEANQPHVLKDGDEIILGDLFRRGAKLIFQVVQPTGQEIVHQDQYTTSQTTDGQSNNMTIVDDNATELDVNEELYSSDALPTLGDIGGGEEDEAWLDEL